MELDRPPQPTPPLTDLTAAIHRAAAAAAALSVPAPSSHAAAAVSALRDAHTAIGSFLSRLDASSGDDQPMADSGEELEEDGEGAQMVGEVEEGLRDCGLQGSKRRKRPVPPSWPLGRPSSSSSKEVADTAAPVNGRRGAAARGHGSLAAVPCVMRRKDVNFRNGSASPIEQITTVWERVLDALHIDADNQRNRK